MKRTVIDKPELAQQVGDQISQLAAAMGRASAVDILRLLQREELSMSRALALIYVEAQEAASISDICTYLNLSLGNTSHLVEQLVCGGYVTRTEDLTDRRLRHVMLTDKGRSFVREVKSVRVRDLALQLEPLPVTLLQSASTLLSTMLDYLLLESVKEKAAAVEPSSLAQS